MTWKLEMTLFRQPSIALGVCEILLVLNEDGDNDNDSGGLKQNVHL